MAYQGCVNKDGDILVPRCQYLGTRKGKAMTLQQAFLNVAATQPTSEDVKRRLDRAYDIVRSNGSGYSLQRPLHKGDAWKVHKASTQLLEDNSITYLVSSAICTCPDFVSARGGMCKHRLAVAMMIEMEE